MGEEQKEEEKKVETPKEEEKKEEEAPPEIVLKVDMHCEACARKVERSLRKFKGLEEVKADSRAKTVVVKGKSVDPIQICERVQKKTHKKVELISPLPKPPEEEKKDEEPPKEEPAPPPPEEKKEEPKTIVVVLKIRLHCEACARVLQKRIKKMEGVESVETDLANDQIVVKGVNIDPNSLVENVYKRTRRQAFVQEEKKEEEEEKKEEKKEEEKKEEEKKETETLRTHEEEEFKKYEFWPNIYNNNIRYAHPAYPIHNYPPYHPYQPSQLPYGSYVPAPDDHTFSDENPNACLIM